MYTSETGCPFPVYADPTRKLYDELGMVRTLALGSRPAYMKKGLLKNSLDSAVQIIKKIPTGLATKAGDQRQIGGEFLFEPLNFQSPLSTPWTGDGNQLGHDEKTQPAEVEEKLVTWCHRMKNTRDHVEVPELMEILGLDGHGKPIDDQKRWNKALGSRKGTGLSMASQMNAMKAASATDAPASAAV
jgi:hypothetical protein